MIELRESLLADIHQGLLTGWMKAKKLSINTQVDKEIPGTNAASGALKSRRREALTTQATQEFELSWANIVTHIEQQYDLLCGIVEEQILTRHRWILSEQPSTQKSLKDIFLRSTLEKCLFDLLENKSPKATAWNELSIDPLHPFTWKPLDFQAFAKQIEGYPLSNPDFYNDRLLPTYTVNPFVQPPMRYDLYRLLKNPLYEKSFKPKLLTNGVVCTAMAPLHIDELKYLTPEEWKHFETILLNIGAENDPIWVLLDKKQDTIYAPAFLEGACRRPELENFQFSRVDHISHTIYSEINDWHAILLSRVLPWSRLPQAQKPKLDAFRSGVPIPLLLQNALEASCLPAQKKVELAAQKAFSKRKPFSLLNVDELYTAELQGVPAATDYLFLHMSETPASVVMTALDKGQIQYDPIENKVTLAEPSQFVEGMKLAYYQKVKTLDILIPLQETSKPWFAYNLDITSVQAPPGAEYSYAHACAARNRFLTSTDYLSKARKIETSHQAWEKTGAYIYQFFKQNTNPDWAQVKNIAEMGKEGLDVFFTYLNTIPKLSLPCTLDLNSGKTIEINEYIDYLAGKIQSYKRRPLFTKLDLILPDPLTESSQLSLIHLITVLNEREELSELSFHNPKGINAGFIKQLKDLAATGEMYLQIKIPQWDDHVFEEPQKSGLKASYREVQNTILSNIRERRQPELNANTFAIRTPKPIRHLNHGAMPVEDRSWRKDVHYPLVSAGLGVQQQAQQEIAQEVQQEAEQQTQPQSAEREIGKFGGGHFITRNNVAESGGTIEDFSSWVGSQVDADFVIYGMDEAAFNKMRAFPSLFKFGIDWKHTPGFRLCHLSDDNKALILTFDAALEAKDIEDQKLEPFAIQMNYSKQATPFDGDYRQLKSLGFPGADSELTLWHHLANENVALAIQTWLSDHGCEPQTSESLQYHDVNRALKKALPQTDLLAMIKDWSRQKLERIEPHVKARESFLTALLADMSPHTLQAFGQLFYHYDAKGNENWLYLAQQIYQKFPQHFYLYKKHLLNPLADWSESLEKNAVDAWTASLQKLEHHPEHQNILWSLVDTHGNTVVAHQDDNLVPMHYSEVWNAYNRVIDYLDANNLNIKEEECLKAILKYQGQDAARQFLRDTHNHSITDVNTFLKDIPRDPSPFNATQFLRRLYEVLQQMGNKPDGLLIQQDILDNLSVIDWHENGFYYACVHENYPYWDRTLALSDLQRLDNHAVPTYTVSWDDPNLRISDELGFTLRYAAQRLQLSKVDFNTFKTTLLHVGQQHPNDNAALFRLMTISIALGLDTPKTIAALPKELWMQLLQPKYHAILQNINQLLLLDGKDLQSHSFHLQMSDLPILVKVLSETDISYDLTVLNALGRALQSFAGDKETQLRQLIKFGRQHGFDHPLLTAFPWLVTDPITNPPKNTECDRFYQQLSSIHFPASTLPDNKTLSNILNKIVSTEDRHQAVQNLIAQDCFIADQDADFRLLKPNEKSMVDGFYLSKTFGSQNRLLLKQLFDRMAIKDEGDTKAKIQTLLQFFQSLDKKNYYDELGQLLGLLVEKSRDNHQSYSLEQLSVWINSVYDKEVFKTRPYPVPFINAFLTDALQNTHSSLINKDLRQLTTQESRLEPLQSVLKHINLAHFSDRVKQTLVKSAIQYKYEVDALFPRFETIFAQQHAHEVTGTLCAFITTQLQRDPALLLQNLKMLEKLALPSLSTDENRIALWESNQVKLFEGLTKQTLSIDNILLIANTENESIRMILGAALSELDNENSILIKMVQSQLMSLKPNELQTLTTYYQTEPRPSLTQLNTLLTLKKPMADLLKHYERVTQAEGKRNYSVDAKEAIDLKRVLSGFKLKGQRNLSQSEQAGLLNLLYYTNTYSQIKKLENASDDDLLDLIQANKTLGTDEAKARVLACMREMVLRKTGKWINQTQMLDLIYAALHNDESLLHQLRTGEGKSLITLMRVAFRALNGQVVDVFSSKESLSERDHKEFAHVFDAFGIRHSHITDKSDPNHYYSTVNEHGIGAVHYATIGNFSLFLSGLSWENKAQIDVHAENRVAHLDEGDHILRFEKTLFNFSDQTEGASVYNYDAWVYEVTHDFYLEFQDKLKNQDFNAYEEPDLQILYQRLQAASLTIAPDKSAFFQKYLASGDVTLRNQKLMKLLTAAHMAQGLDEGVHFSVMEEQKKISETATLDIRFAKVMIDNQVYHGSTYSDLVQQLLHVRLNKEARTKGERPNFFIDPESEIALSLNAEYVLKNYYQQIEACTGTPGNKEVLAYYKKEFGIHTVIKLPTHEKSATLFLPPIYASNEDEQIAAIVASILDNPDQPILITCKDDKAVAHLGALIQKALGGKRSMVIDTNAKGFSEEEIVKDAGKKGAITISSRMGRGTDIKPFDKELGLKVIRTYPATPEIVKQEQGRQGRNAAGGICQDIINYAAVQEEVDKYANKKRFIQLFTLEKDSLEEKLKKHHGENNKKWQEIRRNPVMRGQYLDTRTLQRYQYEILEESKQSLRARDALIAEGSGQVMEHLYTLTIAEKIRFKDAWKACKQAIETGWTQDTDGLKSRAILDEFYKNNHIHKPVQKERLEPTKHVLQGNDKVPVEELIAFHQKWIQGMQVYERQMGTHQNAALVTALYGEEGSHLARLYQAFHLLNAEQVATFTTILKQYPNCHSISCEKWIEAIELLASDDDIAETYAPRVHEFFAKNPGLPKTTDAIKAFSKLFLTAVTGTADKQFIQDIVQDVFPVKRHKVLLDAVELWPRAVVDICKNYMTQEDIVFLLNKVSTAKPYEQSCLDYLAKHHKELKSAPHMIRPLIGLLFQKNPENSPIADYSKNTAALLNFFNQRPGYTRKDFIDMQAKLERIDAQADQIQFLTLLAWIPPHTPARAVLKDLMDLPGKYGFENGGIALQRRMDRIQSAATAFNDFLFAQELIASKDFFETPSNEEEYKYWCRVFSDFPSLEKREHFFTTINKVQNLGIPTLKSLAEAFSAENLSTADLSNEIQRLLQGKKSETLIRPDSVSPEGWKVIDKIEDRMTNASKK